MKSKVLFLLAIVLVALVMTGCSQTTVRVNGNKNRVIIYQDCD